MSCKSALYVANPNTQVVSVGGAVDLGSVVRRFGSNINLNGDVININGAGYYDVDAVVTVGSTAGGTVTLTLVKDGVAVIGGSATSVLPANGIDTLPITALIREFGCCCDNNSNLSILVSGINVNITNVAVIVERI